MTKKLRTFKQLIQMSTRPRTFAGIEFFNHFVDFELRSKLDKVGFTLNNTKFRKFESMGKSSMTRFGSVIFEATSFEEILQKSKKIGDIRNLRLVTTTEDYSRNKVILILEPGDEASRRPYLQGLADTGVEIILATGFELSGLQWATSFAKNAYQITYNDTDSVEQIFAENEINGILCYYDLVIPFANKVAEKFNLPKIFDVNGVNEKTLRQFCLWFQKDFHPANKGIQRYAFEASGLKSPKFKVVAENEIQKCVWHEYPAIVKPAYSTELGQQFLSNWDTSSLLKIHFDSVGA
jgi:hypothetical protein